MKKSLEYKEMPEKVEKKKGSRGGQSAEWKKSSILYCNRALEVFCLTMKKSKARVRTPSVMTEEEEHRECAKLACPLLILKWQFLMDCVFGGSKRAKTQNK
jgi:hypothetical protein